MRRLLAVLFVLLVLLAGVVFAGDRLLTAEAEERVAARAEEEFGAPAEVELDGWPVTLRVLAGQGVPRVDVRAVDVPAGGGTLERVHVTLTDLAVDLGDVRAGLDGLPPARTASFEAEVGQESLQDMMGVPVELAVLSLDDGGARLDVVGFAAIEADVSAQDGMVVIEPRSPAAAFLGLGRIPLDLSSRPGSPYVEETETSAGTLVLRGRLRALEASNG